MGKFLEVYKIIIKTFGFQVRPIGTFFILQVHRLINGTTRALDHVIYPAFRRKKLDKPVFILGNPRGGTTFVHRFLLNSNRLCAFELWEMLFPAISARKLFGGVVDRLTPLSPARYHSSDAHETSLRDIETDDAMSFLHFIDGWFLWAYFYAWEDEWGSERSKSFLEVDERQEPKERKWLKYLDGCWRRNLVAKNADRIIVKSSFLTMRVQMLLERYPDAKLIYVVRDPLQTIPSGMSMLTNVLDKSYHIFSAAKKEDLDRFLENLYQGLCHVYREFHEIKKQGIIPEENLKIVTYPSLMNDFENTILDLMEFLEIKPDIRFLDAVRKQVKKQRSYKSKHAYSLESFGLSEERIRKDLDFLYQEYELSVGESGPAASADRTTN